MESKFIINNFNKHMGLLEHIIELIWDLCTRDRIHITLAVTLTVVIIFIAVIIILH